jgi:hypothetical protein
MGTRKMYVFEDEIEQSLLEEHTLLMRVVLATKLTRVGVTI